MREKVEFESFLMRLHGIQSIRFVSRDSIVLKSASETVASATVKKTGKGQRLVLSAASNKWAALLRFHIARQYRCPVRMYDPHTNFENSCSNDRCFRYLHEAFPREWKRFQGLDISADDNKSGDNGVASTHHTPATIGPIIVNRNDGGGRADAIRTTIGGEECVVGHIRQFAEQLEALIQTETTRSGGQKKQRKSSLANTAARPAPM